MAKPKFPFTSNNEKGHHYVSVHDVAKIEIEGPELITDNSPKQETYWGCAIIVTTKHGETFVLNMINQDEKPALETADKIAERKQGWWRKPTKRPKRPKRSKLSTDLPEGTLRVVAPGRPFTVKAFRTAEYVRDRAAKAPHTYRLVTDPAEVARVHERHETDWKVHVEAMEGTYDEAIGRTICIEQLAQ